MASKQRGKWECARTHVHAILHKNDMAGSVQERMYTLSCTKMIWLGVCKNACTRYLAQKLYGWECARTHVHAILHKNDMAGSVQERMYTLSCTKMIWLRRERLNYYS